MLDIFNILVDYSYEFTCAYMYTVLCIQLLEIRKKPKKQLVKLLTLFSKFEI